MAPFKSALDKTPPVRDRVKDFNTSAWWGLIVEFRYVTWALMKQKLDVWWKKLFFQLSPIYFETFQSGYICHADYKKVDQPSGAGGTCSTPAALNACNAASPAMPNSLQRRTACNVSQPAKSKWIFIWVWANRFLICPSVRTQGDFSNLERFNCVSRKFRGYFQEMSKKI